MNEIKELTELAQEIRTEMKRQLDLNNFDRYGELVHDLDKTVREIYKLKGEKW